jgi:hypothetical protein
MKGLNMTTWVRAMFVVGVLVVVVVVVTDITDDAAGFG